MSTYESCFRPEPDTRHALALKICSGSDRDSGERQRTKLPTNLFLGRLESRLCELCSLRFNLRLCYCGVQPCDGPPSGDSETACGASQNRLRPSLPFTSQSCLFWFHHGPWRVPCLLAPSEVLENRRRIADSAATLHLDRVAQAAPKP